MKHQGRGRLASTIDCTEQWRDKREVIEGRLAMEKKGKVMQRVLLFRKERREISRDDKFLVRIYGDYRQSMTRRRVI